MYTTTVGSEALHDDCEGKLKLVGNSQRAPVHIPPDMYRIRMAAVCIKNIWSRLLTSIPDLGPLRDDVHRIPEYHNTLSIYSLL